MYLSNRDSLALILRIAAGALLAAGLLTGLAYYAGSLS